MVCTLVTDPKCLVSIDYNWLANGVMYFSILTSLKLYYVILCFVDGIFSSRFLMHSMADLQYGAILYKRTCQSACFANPLVEMGLML